MKPRSLSWLQFKILLLVAIITTINFIDRSSISFAIKPIEDSFGITNAEFGVIAAAFSIGYITTTFFGGVIVDKFGTIGTWAVSAVLWSIATMLLSTAQGFWSFFWLRVFLGIAEGIHFPALLRTVTDWLPLNWRARATALGLFGIPFASIVGAPLTTYLIDAFSWRVMFVILGSFGVLWAIMWLFLFRKHPEMLFKPVSCNAVKPKIPLKQIIFNPTFQITCAVYFVFGYTVSFVLMWLPGYLAQTYGSSIRSLGYLVLPPWICSAVLVLLGGMISDRLWKKTRSLRVARTYLMGASLLISGLCFIPIAFTHNLQLDLIWMSLGLGSVFILSSPVYTLNADMFGSSAGTVQGITSSFFALAGILAPSITGWIVQITGDFQMAILFVSVLSFSSALIALLFQQPDRSRKLLVTS